MSMQNGFQSKGRERKTMELWKNRKLMVVLAAICLLQLGFLAYYGSWKSFLMCDELFTYTSSNNAEVQAFDMPLNEWLDEDWYLSQATIREGHAFDYAIPYRNQEIDVHPPLYYMMMHTLSSFVPGQLSFAVGVGLNIFFMLGCTILLYFLSKEVWRSQGIGLVVAALFGFTYGACNMVLFIRMYTLMAFLILAHAYVYIRFMEEKKLTWKTYLLLGITLVLGVLTHYYFILLAFFMAVWYFVKLWIQKRYREDCILHVLIEVCALVCLVVFPAMWNHIFNDYRGQGARENLVNISGYGGALKNMLRFLNEQLFGGALWLLLGAGVVLLALDLKKNRRFPWKELERVFPILFMAAGYFCLVTKIAPFITDRYLMPIYPFVYLLVAGGLCWLLGKLVKFRTALTACVVVFTCLSIGKFGKGMPAYAYTDFRPHQELAKQYADLYCVCIDREYEWWDYYHAIQLLKEYKAFYCISYGNITEDIEVGMQAFADEENVIVYVGDSELNEEITAYVQETVGARELELLDEYDRWKIYLGRRGSH